MKEILGLVSLVMVVIIICMKDIRKILIGEIAVNIVVAVSFLLQGGYAAAGMNAAAVIYVIVAFLYNRQDKKMPLWLLLAFGALFVAWGAVAYKDWRDLLPIACSVLFILAVMQKEAAKYRIYKVFNSILYVIYDIVILLYSTVPTHAFLVVVGIFAIIRLDIMPKRKAK